ncbi:MAG: hypothetical protein U5K43_02835 [Halofilum sp. (in: g-proteobacteria)]|nr:hypothetical protein [Halofilum sp. (in: g-proteobacteria)]
MTPLRVSVCSYNLWNTERWPAREPALRQFLERFEPDLLGVQELRPETRDCIDTVLAGHDRVVDELAGWSGEGNLWWRRALFEHVEHGAPGFGSHEPDRRLFWVRLRRADAGGTVIAATAHLTHTSHEDEARTGQSPRIAQARAIVEALEALVRPGEPAWFMGDLNDPYHPGRILHEAGYVSCFAALGLQPPPTFPAIPTAWKAAGEHQFNACFDWIAANAAARPLAAHAAALLPRRPVAVRPLADRGGLRPGRVILGTAPADSVPPRPACAVRGDLAKIAKSAEDAKIANNGLGAAARMERAESGARWAMARPRPGFRLAPPSGLPRLRPRTGDARPLPCRAAPASEILASLAPWRESLCTGHACPRARMHGKGRGNYVQKGAPARVDRRARVPGGDRARGCAALSSRRPGRDRRNAGLGPGGHPLPERVAAHGAPAGRRQAGVAARTRAQRGQLAGVAAGPAPARGGRRHAWRGVVAAVPVAAAQALAQQTPRAASGVGRPIIVRCAESCKFRSPLPRYLGSVLGPPLGALYTGNDQGRPARSQATISTLVFSFIKLHA